MGNTITTKDGVNSQSISYEASFIDLLNQQINAKDAWPVSWQCKKTAGNFFAGDSVCNMNLITDYSFTAYIPPKKTDTFKHFSSLSLWPFEGCHNRFKLIGFGLMYYWNEGFTDFGGVRRSEGSFNIDRKGILSVNLFAEFPKKQDIPYSWNQPYQREGGGLSINVSKNFSIGLEVGVEHYLKGFGNDMPSGTYPFIGFMFTIYKSKGNEDE